MSQAQSMYEKEMPKEVICTNDADLIGLEDAKITKNQKVVQKYETFTQRDTDKDIE